MVKSMTGFGRGVFSGEKRTITVEVKSINHRYSEISVRLPRKYSFAEDSVKTVIKNAAPRGKIDVMISVDELAADQVAIRLNTELAKKYYDTLKALKDAIPGISGEPSLPLVANFSDVIQTAAAEEDEEEILKEFTEAAAAAAESLDAMRRTEGEKLAADIVSRGDLIEKTVLEVERYAPQVAVKYAAKLKDRITELTQGLLEIPQDRILLEAAVFADKANITEEIVRLKSHVGQLRSLIAAEDGPSGKKLDFLVQEMNREANTIGSKANDIEITSSVLLLKAEIEKIREQVQNIE